MMKFEIIELLAALFAMAQIGLLTAIFFRLGNLVAIVGHHEKRIAALEKKQQQPASLNHRITDLG